MADAGTRRDALEWLRSLDRRGTKPGTDRSGRAAVRRFSRDLPAGVSESGRRRVVPARGGDAVSPRCPRHGCREHPPRDCLRTVRPGHPGSVLERRPRRDGDGAGPVHAVGRPPASATPLRARRGRRPCRFPVLLRRTPGNAGGRRGPMARSGAPGAVLPGAVLASPVDRCGPERAHRVRLGLRRGGARSRRVPGLRRSPRPVVAGRVRGRRGGPGYARPVGSDRNCCVPPGRSGSVAHEPARVAGRRAGVARRGRMAFPAAHRTGKYGPAPCPFFSGAGGGRHGSISSSGPEDSPPAGESCRRCHGATSSLVSTRTRSSRCSSR